MALRTFIKRVGYTAVRVAAPRNAAVILTYHSISNAEHFGAVTPENFERQMRALKQSAFNVVSLEQLAEYRKSGKIPPRTVCLTFDDGYLDNYSVAFPLLKELSLPATIFVIAGSIGGEVEMRDEKFAMLSEEHVRGLSASGLIQIEPHTMSHHKLHQLSPEEAQREVLESKETLEALTGRPCKHFAYPKGRYNEVARAAVERAGIKYAYTTEEGFVRAGDNDLLLRRNGINRTVTLPEFLGTIQWGRLSKARLRDVVGL